MKCKKPKDTLEKQLQKKENWKIAQAIESYWHEDQTNCDLCKNKIVGRHMIDGKRFDILEWALMCPHCHKQKGEGFGEGKGQLYTKLISGKWMLTYGFTSEQLTNGDDDFDEEDD